MSRAHTNGCDIYFGQNCSCHASQLAELEGKYAELSKVVDALADSVGRYGNHEYDCHYKASDGCTCGFWSALKLAATPDLGVMVAGRGQLTVWLKADATDYAREMDLAIGKLRAIQRMSEEDIDRLIADAKRAGETTTLTPLQALDRTIENQIRKLIADG